MARPCKPGDQSHRPCSIISLAEAEFIRLQAMRIDSHQHFWIYAAPDYPWIQPDWPLRRDFLPSDLAPILDASGFDASIGVQARQTMEESR